MWQNRGTLAIVALCLLPGRSMGEDGQKDVPQKARQEIERRGAMVESVGGWQDGLDGDSGVRQALQPPRDDSDKWFVSIIKTAGCRACEQLRADWEVSPVLLAWGKLDPRQHASSWSHCKVFDEADPSQAWRWAKWKPERFPCVLIQPPADGRYGSAGLILPPIYGYDGDPLKLSEQIRSRVVDHIRKFQGQSVVKADGGTGQWTPPVVPIPPLNPPSVPPSPFPAPGPAPGPLPLPLPGLDTSAWWMMLVTALTNAFLAWLEWRRQNPRPPRA